MSANVVVDTSDFDRGMARLASGLPAAGQHAAAATAEETAAQIRPGVPVLTGRLLSTVGVVPLGLGYGVTYGNGLPYAWYIEGRGHAVNDALRDAPSKFQQAATATAEREVIAKL